MNQIFKFTCLAILSFWVWGTFVQHADGAIHIFLGVGLYGSLLCLLSERAADARAQRLLAMEPQTLAGNNTGEAKRKKQKTNAEAKQPVSSAAPIETINTANIRPPHNMPSSNNLVAPQVSLILYAPRPIGVVENEVARCENVLASHETEPLKTPNAAQTFGTWMAIVQPEESQESEECKTLIGNAEGKYFSPWQQLANQCFSIPLGKFVCVTAKSNRHHNIQKIDGDLLTQFKKRTQSILQEMRQIREGQCAMSKRFLAVKLHTFRSQRLGQY